MESRSPVRVTVFPDVSRSRLPVHTTPRQLLDGYVMRCGGRCDAASIHTGNGEATSGFGAHGCTHTDQHLGQSTATGRAHEYLVWNLLGQFPYSDHATMLPGEVLAHIGVESEILNQTLLRYPVAEATAIDYARFDRLGLVPSSPTVLRSRTRNHRRHRASGSSPWVRDRALAQLPTCRHYARIISRQPRRSALAESMRCHAS